MGSRSEPANIHLGSFARPPGQVLAGGVLQAGYPAQQPQMLQAAPNAHILPEVVPGCWIEGKHTLPRLIPTVFFHVLKAKHRVYLL